VTTPWDNDRDEAERTGALPFGFLHRFHRHFASDVIHRDDGPECDQPGTPRRVYVFDPDVLSEHEAERGPVRHRPPGGVRRGHGGEPR